MMNLQESIDKSRQMMGLIKESSELKLRRILGQIDDLINYGLNTHYAPKKICGLYKNKYELVDVVSEWVVERMYYEHFGNLDDNGEEWGKIYHMINQYIEDNHSERIKENFSEDCW